MINFTEQQRKSIEQFRDLRKASGGGGHIRIAVGALLAAYDEAKRDAARYRWLRQHLNIASDGPGEWTCWLALDCIPYRFDPAQEDAAELLDALVARFPLAGEQA